MQGILKKMQVRLGSPVQYEFVIGEQRLALNALIGKPFKFTYTGNISCVNCNRSIKKSFNQGYCYPCFISLAECDMCIMKPETCHYAAGTCRDSAWGEEFCLKPHTVYLANSSGIKVGITRQTQIPTRWIDQGAIQALPIFRVQSRYISGLIEVAIANHVSDKTSWQQMLKNHVQPIDLAEKRDDLIQLCKVEIDDIVQRFGLAAITFLPEEPIVDIQFPVDHYPVKIKSLNLDKDPEVQGILQGIKGQYLLLDTGVINIRKYTGYEVKVTI
ncbi:MAG: DUF2797 domain-containing protein [Methylococcales bacterium]